MALTSSATADRGTAASAAARTPQKNVLLTFGLIKPLSLKSQIAREMVKHTQGNFSEKSTKKGAAR
jgi:hypothetical protein